MSLGRVLCAMEHDRTYDEASHVEAADGDVVVDGPDGVAISFTPKAAIETSDRLMDAGLTAQGQRVAKRSEGGTSRPPDQTITQYRFVAPAIHGVWRNSREQAVEDALKAGQASRDPRTSGKSIRGIILQEWTTIEERKGSRTD